MSTSLRCKISPSDYLHLWWRVWSTLRHIGPSTTNIYLRMKFALQRWSDFIHPGRMKLMEKFSTIFPWLVNTCVTLWPPWRLKVTVRELQIKSIILRLLRKRKTILRAMHLQGCHIRRRQGLVSYQSAISKTRMPPSIFMPSVTMYCSKRQECLTASINHIALKLALEIVLTRHLSRQVHCRQAVSEIWEEMEKGN